jgi:hypothetical protein
LTDFTERVELNTAFYTYLKRIYSNEYRLNTELVHDIFLVLSNNIKNDIKDMRKIFYDTLDEKLTRSKKESKLEEYERISILWTNKFDIKLFILASYLIYIKDIIKCDLEEMIEETGQQGHPLSITYDNISATAAYRKRAVGLLISSIICDYYLGEIKERPEILHNIDPKEDASISNISKEIVKSGVDIKSMFGIVMNESISQSIKSSAGGGYEDRIYDMLIEIGIPKSDIDWYNHDETGSIEHDFIFKFNKKTYGISAKRTLRERYKQYVNLLDNKNADILIAITFGTDLTAAKAKTIRGFGVYIFIAPEIYERSSDLQKVDGVYSIGNFNKETLKKLT